MTGNESNIKVDNFQGVMKISTQSSGTISLGTVETAKFVIDAPNADVKL